MVFSTQNMISPKNKQTNKQTHEQTNKQTKQNKTTVNRTGPPQGFKSKQNKEKQNETNNLTQPIVYYPTSEPFCRCDVRVAAGGPATAEG